MSEQSRTPTWWRRLPSWFQALLLAVLLPGVVAHEMTHAFVARPYGTWSMDWDHIAVDIEWRSSRPGPRAAVAIAPLVSGYAVAVGAVAAVLGQPGITIHTGLLAYVSVNWLCYTVASIADVQRFATAVRHWRRARHDSDADADTR